MNPKAYLVLKDGTVYEGESIGATGTVTAEIVFTTAMTGYMETLTDPSFYGQIVLQTFPLIGNYGVITEDTEAAHPALRGYVIKNLCDHPSNFRSEDNLRNYLKEEGIVALAGIDTRALTKRLREKGVMAAVLTTDPEKATTESLNSVQFPDAVQSVSRKESLELPGNGPRVLLWDFGAKASLEQELSRRGANVICIPAETTAEEVLALKPDGIVLSNGPGNPQDVSYAINALRELLPHHLPTFGICLGHQLLALAHDFSTYKLKCGHRGANQPVRDMETGRVYITNQNHGYAVDAKSIDPEMAKERFVGANDGVCEGIDYLKEPAFSVQFYPISYSDPQDTASLFNRFFAMMEV